MSLYPLWLTPLSKTSSLEWLHRSVALTEDQAPTEMTPLFFTMHYQQTTMSHQLPDQYWELLGPNGPFLCELFHNQSQLVMQLQAANNDLQTRVMDAPDNVANMASQATLAVAQTILTNVQAPTGGQPLRNAKAANPETFDGSQGKTEQFVQSIHIAVTMQIDAFADERMKILYVLSFMCQGMAQVWAANETSVVLANTSTFNTLEGLLTSIESTFGDPDNERMAHAQLHALRMTPGMTTEEYTTNFEMISGRTGFNHAALQDTYVQGLPQSILLKVYSQTSLLSGMDNWKAIIRNLDCLQRGYAKLTKSILPNRVPFPQMNTPAVAQTLDTSAP